ncbi:MAG: iron-containing redox enzyme family protein [Candidatus Eremiobacteraeota bacterium]|nr:iron-containing redox enzyme family protein [Candidatus Eremiobacteraeota bacterium]MCW5867974.1 iron-containing redox enzyme family protein [Candidatus Eremiobacteraeota bacterium]
MSWVLKQADQVLAAQPIHSHPYFAELPAQMTRERFLHGQKQFFHAVTFFSRAMGALLARQPDSDSRRVLMHNLAEEHGLEEGHGLAHDRTFRQFLASLGSQPDPQAPPVRAFNLALYGACCSESVAFAFACLGIIEYAFADISALIGSTVVERGWVAQKDLVHYSLHAEIDKRHAAEFFEVVEGAPEQEVTEGLRYGWHIFAQLYRSL